MKTIIGFILAIVIMFFVWNILKRIFFKSFYQFPNQSNQNKEKSEKKNINQKINWDAETVDYEEVKDEKTPKTNS